MAAQYWESVLNSPSAVASGTALASSSTLTDISPAPQLILPANFLQPGMSFRLTAAGVFSNTATPTLLLGFYIGGVAGAAICASGAVTTITAATAWSWSMEARFTVRTTGTGGTIFALGGKLWMPASLTQMQAAYAMPATAPATVTVDTTAAKAITVGAQWGTLSASNTVQCHGIIIEQLN
jgi:hypothetical protein